MQRAVKLYNRLLSFYPARFREEYQTAMEKQFRDEYRDAGRGGARALFWMRVFWDVVSSAPGQLVRELGMDLKHSIRVYRRRPFSVGLAVGALGLAMGASTGVFSVLNALLIRSLPFFKPEQLVELWLSPVNAMKGRAAFTEWRSHSSYLQSAATFASAEMNLTGDRGALRVKIAETSANFFDMLGMKAAAGRTFAADGDVFGHGAVAVISYGLWQQVFGGVPEVTGKVLHINGARLTVIGVAAANFDYPGKTAVWTPTVFDYERVPKRGVFFPQTIARLKEGVSLQQAQWMYRAEAQRVADDRQAVLDQEDENRPHLSSLQDQLAGPVRQASWVLAGMTLLVLVTACANVAQLLLSRATERQQELALRAALGASRARLLQQLITEATLLTMSGAALGLVLAHWTCKIALSIAPATLATQRYTVLDWRVLGFASALSLVMGVLFGAAPVWLIGRLQPSGESVRAQTTGTRDLATRRARQGLIAVQAALTLVLLTGSLAMGRTFLHLLQVDLGFRTANVVTLNVSLEGTSYRSGRGEWQFYREALNQIRAVPGVDGAGGVGHLPLTEDSYMANAFTLDSGQRLERIITNAVTPGYFNAMGTRVLAGRDFTEMDDGGSRHTVIVNEAFAKISGLGTRIIGRTLKAEWSRTPYEIAGVVSTSRIGGPSYAGGAQVYWPIAEEPPAALTFVAHVHGQPEEYLAMCRDAVRKLDPKAAVYDVKTLEQRLSDVLSRPKFYTTATIFLAVLASLLAVVGIYGTASYSISQRRHEMGVRMAVGASYGRVRRMMLGESALPIISGAAAGIALSILCGHSLAHLVEAASRPAWWTYAGAAGFLLLGGLGAAWSATEKVLSIDPADALRAE